MDHFILRFTGKGTMPESDLTRIRQHPDVTVEDSSSRMLLVQSTPQAVKDLAEELPDWICTPQRTYPVPDPRPKIRSS